MAGGGGEGVGAVVPSLLPPCPRSPPEYPDLYGRRREFAKVQMLEREIGFLQEELESVEGFHPASRYCKEVVDFSLGNSDPLIPTFQKSSASCGFWKWLWNCQCRAVPFPFCSGVPWLNFSWICCRCYAVYPPDLEPPCCCSCDSSIHCPDCCPKCSLRKWPCFSGCRRLDCHKPNRCCHNGNCLLQISRHPRSGNSSCCGCNCLTRPKCSCPKLQLCFNCNGPCCSNPCYYCH